MRTLLLFAITGLAAAGLVACGQAGSNANSMNHNSMMKNSNSSMNMNGMDHNSMPMNSNMSMDHSSMKSSPNAASQPYDLQFIDTMTAHHKGAVEMAKMVDGRTQNPDLMKFALQIISDQDKEIEKMKGWREKWFSGKPNSLNMEMPGMEASMKSMQNDGMKKMESATGPAFETFFLVMMIEHHKGAISMATEALSKSDHIEVKSLSNQIIKAQETEIKMMESWIAKRSVGSKTQSP